jgi:signal transduction histidine kinase
VSPAYAGPVLDPDVLLPSALGLLGEGARADDLGERLALHGATLDEGVAARILERGLALGLVRVARDTPKGPVHVLTSLGRAAVAAGPGGDAAVPLEELERLRTDLVATIAHELRTPLTAVRTSAGLLADPSSTPTPDQRTALLASIERNADRMQRLIDDVLDLARFRSGSIRLQLRRFDAPELAESAAGALRPIGAARRVQLEVSADDQDVDTAVYGDHRRLEQALVNLVSNAVRFSPEAGTVRIRVTVADGTARWAVRDDGPGIPPPDQARLFERFFVGRSDRTAARDGIGLGLPTALAIAQAHGGTIDVASTVGEGSTFTLAVPIDGPPDLPAEDR